MGVSGQRHAPAALLPPGKGTPVPIVQEGGWAPEETEARGKILCTSRGSNLDRPVVQPVVRHYTAWANPAPNTASTRWNFNGVHASKIIKLRFESWTLFPSLGKTCKEYRKCTRWVPRSGSLRPERPAGRLNCSWILQKWGHYEVQSPLA
jgi:hypothetical protein